MRIEDKSFYADLYSKSTHGDPAPVPPPLPAAPLSLQLIGREAPLRRQVVRKATARETLPVPVERPKQSTGSEPIGPKMSSTLAEVIGTVDTHHLSPRQMANLSLDLYVTGALNFEDYAELAFQPELHPDFDKTIGALTGEKAAPDRPRDFVRLWEEKAKFQRRHNNERSELIERSERIAHLLRHIGTKSKALI